MARRFTFTYGDQRYVGEGATMKEARRNALAQVSAGTLAEIRQKQSELPFITRMLSRFVMKLVLR